MPHVQLNGRDLQVWPLAERDSQLDIEAIAVDPQADPPAAPQRLLDQVDALAASLRSARQSRASMMLAYGAHLVKNGAGPLVTWLIEHGWLTHLATQGAGIIHDWEFAYLGRSSESVRGNAAIGRFGAWDETGRAVNIAAVAGAAEGIGLGEAIGRYIHEDGWTLPEAGETRQRIDAAPHDPRNPALLDLLQFMRDFDLPAGRLAVPHRHKQFSISAAAFAGGVPLTVHPGIGYDIYANHPMFHGAAIGRASGTDQRIFAGGVENLTNGVYLSVGSAIMSPQVFEKAYSASNNIRLQAGRPTVRNHRIAIVDIQAGGDWDWAAGEPPKDHPAYYLRFCKSFYRMGGTVDYLCADNRLVLHHLVARLR
ncbi:MAG: hypothetical protein GVY16_00980 [Planctomycetes bacterium]|jgi:hypothetical protein|nr:hypothetical protein [Planctomycetota bacterium]